jgi:hypothetical protein
VNVTLVVVLNPANHALPNDKQARRNKRGDIVDIRFTSDVGAPQGRLGYVHITGVPDRPLEFLKEKLLDPLTVLIPYSDTVDQEFYDKWVAKGVWPMFAAWPTTVVNNGNGTYTATGLRYVLARKRGWRIPASVLPANVRNQLLNNREITVTWLQAKPYVRNKIVADRFDSTQDDETTELSDSDIG